MQIVLRKLNKCSISQLVLSLVTIGELQVSLSCEIHHGQVRISLPTIIVTADDRTRRHHEYKFRTPPASCIIYPHPFYVRFIPMWNSLTQEAVTAPTAEALQKAALEVIKSP